MIVTRGQYERIRHGRLASVFVPPYAAQELRPAHTYLTLDICERVEGHRCIKPTDIAVTIIGLGQPESIGELFGRTESQPEYWELLYPEHVGDDCVWVAFALGDWRSRKRFLGPVTPGSPRGYASTPVEGYDDLEAVDDDWLAKFAKEANAHIEEQQRKRQERYRAARSFSRATRFRRKAA